MKIILLFFIVFVLGCSTPKEIPYFQNIDKVDLSTSSYLYDLKIRPQDELAIFVFAPAHNESVLQFNKRKPQDFNPTTKQIIGTEQIQPYLVSPQGDIDFPVVGKIHVAGLTIEQANETIKQKIAPYINEGIDYLVNTNMANYYISVLGEVQNPNTFDVTRNKITVLEALAMAGDLTIYGERTNVKLLRQQDDGKYEIHKLDLTDANILTSPYYYMQQRDVLYVEPNPVKAGESKVGTTTTLWFNGASIVVSLGSLLYMVLDD